MAWPGTARQGKENRITGFTKPLSGIPIPGEASSFRRAFLELTCYVVREGEQIWAFTELSDELLAALGEAVQKHTITLKSPLQYRYQMEADQAMRVQDPMLGWTLDEARRQAATV